MVEKDPKQNDILKQLTAEVEAKLKEKGINVKVLSMTKTLDQFIGSMTRGHASNEPCNCLRERFDKVYADPAVIARMCEDIARDLRATTSVSRLKMTAIVEAIAAGGQLTENPWVDWVRDMQKCKPLQAYAESTWALICDMMGGQHGTFTSKEIVALLKTAFISSALAFLYDHIRGSKTDEQVNDEFENILEYVRQRDSTKKVKPN